MFGYLRPAQGELKVFEFERYKECYCGLCHALGKKYGMAARFFLNYELVFLSMLLWEPGESATVYRKRCIASPHKKKCFCAMNNALEDCAGYNVILSQWKLRDTINDEPFLKSLKHRALSLLLTRAYKKASREYAKFDAEVAAELQSLAEYELRGMRSLDGAADKFARVLCAAVPLSLPDTIRRPMHELLYHLGRWIYVIDACDDYSDDLKSGNYNPVALLPASTGDLVENTGENLNEYKYEKAGGDKCENTDKISDEIKSAITNNRLSNMSNSNALNTGSDSTRHSLPPEVRDRLQITLTHSNNLICSAFELLPENAWTGTLRNTIYIGMNEVMHRVMNGNWNSKQRRPR